MANYQRKNIFMKPDKILFHDLWWRRFHWERSTQIRWLLWISPATRWKVILFILWHYFFYMQTLNYLSCNNSYYTCSLEPYLTGLWILQLICCHIFIEIDKFLKYIFYLALRHILSIPTLYASKIKVHQFTIHVHPLQPELINLKIIYHKKYDMQFYLLQI